VRASGTSIGSIRRAFVVGHPVARSRAPVEAGICGWARENA
jgi:hypothetical protein